MPGPEKAGRFDIGDIVRAHRGRLASMYELSREQKRVLTDIANCRTVVLGGHLDQCGQCGYEHPSYNSCRNRHCPKCQALVQEKWIAEQRRRMLDVRHFHVVFTLPAELRPLAAFSARVVYEALFHAAGRTLIEFGETRLSATIGATLVLHTWTRDLHLHPHVHAIVTGGGLSLDGKHWSRANRNFLFPVHAMSRVFRGKVIHELRRAYDDGDFRAFDDFQDPEGFARLIAKIARMRWNVYAKTSFSKGQLVLQYLGRYTHRVGLANSRLLAVDDNSIMFRTKGDGVAVLSPVEFLGRFVQHVLPTGFHKIRHVGLNASESKRARARALLGAEPPTIPLTSWRQQLIELTGRDVTICPRCSAPLVILSVPHARAPPSIRAAA
jgi:hypothetical protein